MTKDFETYEQVATFLLNEFAVHFGLTHVESKQELRGHESDATWEIDAKGVKEDGQGFVIIECRRYTTSKLKQEAIGGLAYRIRDTGAAGGIVVTPLELQAGAAKVASAEGIVAVRLDPSSTTSDYVLRFLNKVMIGVSLSLAASADLQMSAQLIRKCECCGAAFSPRSTERICPQCDPE